MQDEVEAACTYEDFHVPALYEYWAPKVLAAAKVAPGDRVLDVACGTGIVGRTAAKVVGETGKVMGVDPDKGMITVARRRARNLEWKVGRAGGLPEDDASYDVVVCQFGLMFVSDPKEAISEMLRVLVPGGRMVIAVWDKIENQTAIAAEAELIFRIAGPKASRALRAPYYLGNGPDLKSLVSSVGFEDCVLSTQRGVARFPSIRHMVEFDLRNALPEMRINLVEEQIERILAEADAMLHPYIQSNGEFAFEVSAHIVTARCP